MVRLLKAALAEEVEDLSMMLTEEILNVDQQLLQVEKVTGEVSGITCMSCYLVSSLAKAVTHRTLMS